MCSAPCFDRWCTRSWASVAVYSHVVPSSLIIPHLSSAPFTSSSIIIFRAFPSMFFPLCMQPDSREWKCVLLFPDVSLPHIVPAGADDVVVLPPLVAIPSYTFKHGMQLKLLRGNS